MGVSEKTGLGEARELAVRQELRRVQESPSFRTAKRCREFLEYIVEHTMSGPSTLLKERSIGMELFHLPPDFDTGEHTVVRVTANEVRKRLAQHYVAENGSHGPVRIDLPPGSYSADFKWEALEQPDVPAAPPGRSYRLVIGCALAIVVVAGAFSLWRRSAAASAVSDVRSTPSALPSALPVGESLRMTAGSSDAYTDRNGRNWGPDRFFTGGSIFVRPTERILRTLDPDIYRHARRGDFRYDIPLSAGSYEMHLHFAETGLGDFISAESSGEGQRLFRVTANGNAILDLFDVVADANGSNTSDERVFKNVSPDRDGILHLNFSSQRGTAILSGIELIPAEPGKARPVRIRSGWTAAWQDSTGRRWQADSYFLGGNALLRATNPAQQSNSTAPDMALYASERWGHFSYAVPVADGQYRVTLSFCEGHYGQRNSGIGGLGSRVFDVYCNGVALLRDFDIYKEAGGEGRPISRTFPRIQPTAQGKIVLSFVPKKGMACVNGIEVLEDSR